MGGGWEREEEGCCWVRPEMWTRTGSAGLNNRLKQGEREPRTLTVRPESPRQAQLARRPVEAGVTSTLAYACVLIKADSAVIAGGIRSSRAGWNRRDSSDSTVS